MSQDLGEKGFCTGESYNLSDIATGMHVVLSGVAFS